MYWYLVSVSSGVIWNTEEKESLRRCEMSFKQFLEFVEIRTKLASLMPFLFGSLYVIYDINDFGNFNFMNFIIMFVSLLFIDMTTTSINNYLDYKKSSIEEFKNKENVIGSENINLKIARNVVFTMLGIAILFGIFLVLRTDLIVLILGIISFVIGIMYTFGPTPISRTPYGEIISGFIMGFVILFLSIIIHGNNIVLVNFKNSIVQIEIDYVLVLKVFLISIPFVLSISNVMLANNTCDLEMDIKNNRFLLPYYIGRKNAVKLFEVNYYISYLVILICIVVKILPITVAVCLCTLPIVYKNMIKYKEKQVKRETFVFAVKNLLVISSSYILGLALGVLVM